jgi:CRISPR-associated endonuclease/helicase Cas3
MPGGVPRPGLAGLLHDLGKYGDLFQRRLEGKEKGLDHWSAGAWTALEQRCAAAALAVQGHHIGLQHLDKRALATLAQSHRVQLRLTDPDTKTLKSRFAADGLVLSQVAHPMLGSSLAATIPSMLDVRMLFSSLVDADYLDTEAHFEGDASGKCYRAQGVKLDVPTALRATLDRIERIQAITAASPEVRAVRRTLLDACMEGAAREPGLFTLTAPTGSGKTLAMLAFALEHAARYGLHRVVIVIPYLTITEQTARIYRDILVPVFGEEFVLEHHSLAGGGQGGLPGGQ